MTKSGEPFDALSEALVLDTASMQWSKRHERRWQLITEAVGWPKGPDKDAKRWAETSEISHGRTIRFGKPGKEAGRGFNRNENDMTPAVFSRGGRDTLYRPSFSELFTCLDSAYLSPGGYEGLEILACLLVRNAWLLDHHWTGDRLRYSPSPDALEALDARIPLVGPLDPEAFLFLADAIAWNEDVKYNADKSAAKLGEAGRPNCLLTLVHYIAVLLSRSSLSAMTGGFTAQPVGISPVDTRRAVQLFPALSHAERSQNTLNLLAERSLLSAFGPYLGETAEEIGRRCGARPSASGNKSAYTIPTTTIATRVLEEHGMTLRSGPFKLKHVRLDVRLQPEENSPFLSLKPGAIVEERDWEDSALLAEASRRLVLVVYGKDRSGAERLMRVLVHTFGGRDLAALKRAWKGTRAAVLAGDDGLLPKESSAETTVAFVNTKNAVTVRNANGEVVTPKAFFLCGSYLRRVILGG